MLCQSPNDKSASHTMIAQAVEAAAVSRVPITLASLGSLLRSLCRILCTEDMHLLSYYLIHKVIFIWKEWSYCGALLEAGE